MSPSARARVATANRRIAFTRVIAAVPRVGIEAKEYAAAAPPRSVAVEPAIMEPAIMEPAGEPVAMKPAYYLVTTEGAHVPSAETANVPTTEATNVPTTEATSAGASERRRCKH